MQQPNKLSVETALLEYSIIEEAGGYGIRIDATTKHSTTGKTVHKVVPDLPRAIALMGLLWKQGVSPVNLEDVLKDMGLLTM